MPLSLELSPTLATLPVYQPGRPIDEVARELGLDAADIIKLASNENPLGPSPKALDAVRRAAAAARPPGRSDRNRVKLRSGSIFSSRCRMTRRSCFQKPSSGRSPWGDARQ